MPGATGSFQNFKFLERYFYAPQRSQSVNSGSDEIGPARDPQNFYYHRAARRHSAPPGVIGRVSVGKVFAIEIQ